MDLLLARMEGAISIQDKLSPFAELVFEITENNSEMMGYMLSVRKEIRSNMLSPLYSSAAFLGVQRIIGDGIASQ